MSIEHTSDTDLNHARPSAAATRNPLYRWLLIIGWVAYVASIYNFFTNGYQGDLSITIAFIQLMSSNILLSGLWPMGRARKKDFLNNFIYFAIQIALLAFILFPDRQKGSDIDLLMVISWIPLAGFFTLLNYLIVKRINRRK